MNEILTNEQVARDIYRMTVYTSGPEAVARPGQFYSIRCMDSGVLLRRPLSVHRQVPKGEGFATEILFRVAGRGTRWLSERSVGERLDMIGPLGNGFLLEEGRKDIAIVARGIGIAPLFGLAGLVRRQEPGVTLTFLLGARFADRLFYEEECSKVGAVYLYTDDGSRGFSGRAPELLEHLLEAGELPGDSLLYACGPAAMLREIALLAERRGMDGQVALETHMGCGFGVCLSCACRLVPSKIRRNAAWPKNFLQWSADGNAVNSLVCKDGPVYDMQEVEWDDWTA